MRVEVWDAPVTVEVEIVTLCDCLTREEAWRVVWIACWRLSFADCDDWSWPPNEALTEPEISFIPPCTEEVTLN